MTAAKAYIGGAWQNVSNRAGSSRQGGSWVPFGPSGGTTSKLITSQTPGTANVFENQNVTVSTTFYTAASGTCTGIQFYAPTSLGSGTFTGVLYSVDTDDSPADTGTGTLLNSVTLSSLVAGTLCEASFSSPTAITSNTAYRIGVRTTEGRYTATGAFFSSTGLTSGTITAPQTQTAPTAVGTVANGCFIESVSLYPNKTFNGGFYFVGPIVVT